MIVKGRFSFKKHGYWIRLKGSTRTGRISYFDKKDRLVWVVWTSEKYTMGGHTYKPHIQGASGHSPDKLVYIPIEPSPWIDFAEVRKAYNRRKGA